MSYSAQTEKLRLPQWVRGSKDHPDFLTDVNQAFEKIDGFAQGIDNTVNGLPEQVEEVATILQSVQEDVGEHTEELARQGVRIAVLENDVNSTNGLAQRVAELETGQGDQDENISYLHDHITDWNDAKTSIDTITFSDTSNSNSVTASVVAVIGNLVRVTLNLDDVKSLDKGAYELSASEDSTRNFLTSLGIKITENLELTGSTAGIYVNPGGIIFAAMTIYYKNGSLVMGVVVQNDPHANTTPIFSPDFIYGYRRGNITDAESK